MTPAELGGRLTITVPEAGEVLGIGTKAAYAAASRGEIPTLRLGRSLRVPVPKLLELVGIAPDMREASARPADATAQILDLAKKQEIHPDDDTQPAA